MDPEDEPWFAIDRLGQVGLFFADGGAPTEVLARLLADVEPEALAYEAADAFVRPRVLEVPPRFDQSLANVLVQLRSLVGARARLATLGLQILPSREGAYAWGQIESPALRELWREGWVLRAVLGHELEPARVGMFRFEHAAESIDEYVRWDAPRVPVRVHALPTSLRSRLSAVRFADVDFRDLRSVRASAAQTG